MTANRGREAAWQAAVVNAVLFVLVPVAWLTYAEYTGEGMRPAIRTFPASAAYALRSLLILFPVSLFIGWRTYVLARGYSDGRTSVWRGPLESAAVGGVSALLFILTATPVARTAQRLLSAAVPLALVAIEGAIVGLALGLTLAGVALLVLRISRAASDTPSFS
jgi:hypothetical protein